ncbi:MULTISPECIES: hypothetical protein [unclassified Microbacterium]|uniref:hypothetical protein n=1 Tax=unclassified Microbacterium TaxID=2609290 RepID=UPI00214B2D4B|nr:MULTISPECIES: hypothetical protein [unclassified Microbacterium]MCR2808340.1 hypothetical protein [Microbacterium sp. zg.B185]WIM19208.1 hypothetical protein QNO12_16810 [Microbacterium sp. zg-B185]
MSTPSGLAAEDLDVLDLVRRQLGDAIDRLRQVSARSAGLADQTRWCTDAATVFHSTADSWRRDVAALVPLVEDARDALALARARSEADAWRHGL